MVHSYNAVPWFTSRGSQLHTQNKGVLNDREKYFSALLTSSTLYSFLLLLVKMSAVDIWSRASPCFLVSTLVVSVHIWPCQRHCCGSNESHSVCGRSLSSDHSLHCGCYQHCQRCRHCFCHLRRAKKTKQREMTDWQETCGVSELGDNCSRQFIGYIFICAAYCTKNK